MLFLIAQKSNDLNNKATVVSLVTTSDLFCLDIRFINSTKSLVYKDFLSDQPAEVQQHAVLPYYLPTCEH